MIRAGIVGYGNLGKALEGNVKESDDFQLVKIFTRRNPEDFGQGFDSLSNVWAYKDQIDILFLALGSARDIPELGPKLGEHFNTVDAYDNHSLIPDHLATMQEANEINGKTSLVATGWDPGLFSFNRAMVDSLFYEKKLYTFWGPGVSQGHSDAIRRIEGVKRAVQYTVPKEEILKNIKDNEKQLSSQDMHDRICFVVSEDGTDQEKIEEEIKTMPDYFSAYHTEVNFISEEDFERDHTGIPHGGQVIGIGRTSDGTKQSVTYQLELESNPQYTSLVNIMCGRACYRFNQEGKIGSYTIFDIPLTYFSRKSREELIKKFL